MTLKNIYFVIFKIFYICTYVCVWPDMGCVSVNVYTQVLSESRKGLQMLWTEVTGTCELLNVLGAGIELGSSVNVVKCS